MVFGLDDKKKTATKTAESKSSDAKKNDDSKGSADEAQELLKKMQEKEDNGDCAFC